jgi:putative transcription antitermination factor YqgF
MRYLGIDYGTKKIGLALSDERGTMGFPHAVMPNAPQALDEIAALAAREGVGGIVMGESRDYSGAENPVATEAKEFAASLAARAGVSVAWEPEFLTSAAARRAPGQPDAKAGRGPKDDTPVDDRAAALILTSYLSRMTNQNPEASAAAPEMPAEPAPSVPAAPRISIDEFSKVDVQVGTVKTAERVPETDKLLRLTVDFGEPSGPRQIVSGIAAYVPEPESLVGRQLCFVTNLQPRKIKGLESDGMLFAVGSGDTFAFLSPDRAVPPGTGAH